MKPFKTKTIEATTNHGYTVITETGYPEGVCIPDKRTARALAEWLLKVTEPAKKLPPAEPRMGSKVTVVASCRREWRNQPGVIIGICKNDEYPYHVEIAMACGIKESSVFARHELKVRK